MEFADWGGILDLFKVQQAFGAHNHRNSMVVKILLLLSFMLVLVLPAIVNDALDGACSGDLLGALNICKLIDSAECTFITASLELILNSNGNKAVSLHKAAKAMNSAVIPPLAKLHLDGKKCGGLGDLFYVTAVITKELVDSNVDNRKLLSGLTTLITLTADSGLHHAAEKQITKALEIAKQIGNEDDINSLLFRSVLMTPGVFESNRHITRTRSLLEGRIQDLLAAGLSNASNIKLRNLDEFVLSPTFYFIYQGGNDKELLTQLHSAYSIAFPALGSHSDFQEKVSSLVYHYQQTTSGRKIRVGFVSSYFRRHSICKLFCGVLTGLAESSPDLEVFAFSSLQETHEDGHTLALKKSLGPGRFVTLGKTLVQNRREVTDRAIDILVYLDVGMEPSTAVWAAARLAPVQVCVWGHPSTTGMPHMDYYVSSEKYHSVHHYHRSVAAEYEGPRGRNTTAQDFFSEQLVQLDSLGFYFERPTLDLINTAPAAGSVTVDGSIDSATAASTVSPLVSRGSAYYEQLLTALTGQTEGAAAVRELIQDKLYYGKRLVLCTQHLPKFHPDFDHILGQILIGDRESVILLIDNANKRQWRRTLEARWRKSFTREVNALLASSTVEELIALSGLHGRKLRGDSPLLNNSTQTIEALLARIVWLPSLSPQEYLSLMAVGHVMLDPFPFGGGVTALEALSVCTPVVSLPRRQNVPSLAAGMLTALTLPEEVEDLLIVRDTEQYVSSVLSLLAMEEDSEAPAVRLAVCNKAENIFSSQSSVREWGQFLSNAAEFVT